MNMLGGSACYYDNNLYVFGGQGVILNKTEKRKFKIDSEMMNLIGCNKESFYSLMLSMNYKKSSEVDTYFYTGESKRKSKFIIKKDENPFKKLLNLNLK